MSATKLTVFQRRLFKFIKQKFLYKWNDSAECKPRMLTDRQHPNPFRNRKSLFRYVPLRGWKSGSYQSKVIQTAKMYWKALPRTFKDERMLLWMSNGRATVPKLARGFKGKANNPASCPELVREKRPTESRRRSPKRKTEAVEVAEQKLYTQNVSPMKLCSSMKRMQEPRAACCPPEPPPVQKCRLSCPLPPAQYAPPEKMEFLSKFQAPIVRFAALQSEFLPRHKPAEGKGYIMNTQGRKVKAHPLPDCEYNDFVSNNIKTRKNLQWGKRQRHKNQEVEPEMKALVFEPGSLSLSCKVVKLPNQIYKDEVLVQVAYSGVCSADMLATEGKICCGDGPIILGQEISGKVYAVGSDVRHVAVGDNVAIDPYTACSVCRHCTRGQFSACQNEGLNDSIGVSKNGGWAEYVVVKKSQVHKIPEQLGLDQATLLQPLSCILKAVTKLKLTYGTQILIQGLGLSGCLWASLLHYRGHRNVLVSDKNENRTKQFDSLNLKYSHVPPEDIRMYSADVIIECTGSPTFIEKSLNVLNPNGKMCFFGRPNPTAEVRCIPYEVVQKEITIFGTAGNSCCFSEAIETAASMGRSYLDPRTLGVRAFELEDYREAFSLKKSGEISKILFKFDS